jgi:polar amino acid transport system substrate-binding protein
MKKKIVVNSIVGLFFYRTGRYGQLSLYLIIPKKAKYKQTSENRRWSRIKKKQITIGLDDTFVPMGFRDKWVN